MGYETKIYISQSAGTSKLNLGKVQGKYRYIWGEEGNRYTYIDNDEKVKVSDSTEIIQAYSKLDISSLDLCKMGNHFHDLIKQVETQGQYYLHTDSDDYVIVKDSYNDLIKTYDAVKFLNVLKATKEYEGDYRRLNTAIILLEDMIHNYENLVVTTFGH